MELSSGGSGDPPSPSPKAKTKDLLTPKSKVTLNRLFLIDESSNESNYSQADLTLLTREIELITATFKNDQEIVNEASELSQTITNIVNNHKPIKKQK